MTHKHLIKGAVILGTTQGQHLVAVDFVPPSPRALEARVANELVGRFNPTATQGIAASTKFEIVGSPSMFVQKRPAVRNGLLRLF
jgi:hypothetical protein